MDPGCLIEAGFRVVIDGSASCHMFDRNAPSKQLCDGRSWVSLH